MSILIDPYRFAVAAPSIPPEIDLAGLVAWWDAGALALADTDPVASWADSSGNGHTMAQATSGMRPLYKATGPNGEPYVDFDNTDDVLVTSAPVSTRTDNFTMVVVTRRTTDDPAVAFYNGSDGSGNGYGPTLRGGSATGSGWLRGGIAWHDGGTRGDIDTWYVLVLRRTSGTGLAYLNGGAGVGSTASAPNTPTTESAMGRHASGQESGLDVAEAVFYDAALSNADLNILGDYLADKYGLTWTNI